MTENLVDVSAELLRVVRDEWTAVGTATGPADREQALDAVRAAYRRAGRPPPARVLWFDSPLAAAVAMWRHNLRSPVEGAIRRAQNWFDDSQKGWPSQPVLDTIRCEVSTPLRHESERWRDLIGDEIRDRMRSTPDVPSRLGRPAPPHPGPARRVGPGYPGPVRPARCGRCGAAGRPDASGLTRRLVVGVHRHRRAHRAPTTLVRDEHGRAHNPDGPAVGYPDGFAVYAWHGVRVPRRVIAGELTGADWLNEERSQVRQAIAERDQFLLRRGRPRLGAHRGTRLRSTSRWRHPPSSFVVHTTLPSEPLPEARDGRVNRLQVAFNAVPAQRPASGADRRAHHHDLSLFFSPFVLDVR